MLVACLVVIAPASWAARAGTAAEAGAEVPFVVLVSGGNSQIHHPGVIRINSDPELQHVWSTTSGSSVGYPTYA
jgi:hypothetical protein